MFNQPTRAKTRFPPAGPIQIRIWSFATWYQNPPTLGVLDHLWGDTFTYPPLPPFRPGPPDFRLLCLTNPHGAFFQFNQPPRGVVNALRKIADLESGVLPRNSMFDFGLTEIWVRRGWLNQKSSEGLVKREADKWGGPRAEGRRPLARRKPRRGWLKGEESSEGLVKWELTWAMGLPPKVEIQS